MADTKTWASRVAAWRASGQTSTEFCEGRDLTPGGLRHWAYRLGKTRQVRGKGETGEAPVKLARVVRRPTAKARPIAIESSAPETAVVIEVGAARIVVRAGVDREALAAAIEALTAQGGGR